MNSVNLSEKQKQRREKALQPDNGVVSKVFHFMFGESSEKKSLAAKDIDKQGKKNPLAEKKFSLALSRSQLRLVNAAVMPCHNFNFRKIGTDKERKDLKNMITFEMFKAAK